jgi:hypothetical protein
MSYSQHQPPATGWRARVRNWLQAVDQDRRMYFPDLQVSAAQHAEEFPRNVLLVIVSQIFRSVAVWIVKSAISDAAAQLGILADVVVAEIAA